MPPDPPKWLALAEVLHDQTHEPGFATAPGVNRVMKYELEKVDGSSKIKIVRDKSKDFNRPNFFVGSRGTVWASEYMRYEEPRLFLTDIDKAQPTPVVYSLLIRLMDQLPFYTLATNDKDVANISSKVDFPHRMHKISRAMAVKKTLVKVQEQNLYEKLPANKVEDIRLQLMSHLKNEKLVPQLQMEMNKGKVSTSIALFDHQCQDLRSKISHLVPPMKSRIHEFTDAGPGVGVTNLDVNFV